MSKKIKGSALTHEQADYLSNRVQEKFGDKLSALQKRLENDVKMFGKPSKETIKQRDNLMKEILDDKRQNLDPQ